ncbi:BTB domain-containing protein [Trichonephila clavata]|uniref:BTB domain-containing protein n=1 Tax=Trichonephila clavata TaxID=2740835 RepID=A0A8X6M3S1_TRICU|nr:BTB domain-containing protein [Trichonephila clavata]
MTSNSEITETSIYLVIKDFSSVIGPDNPWKYEKKERCGNYIFLCFAGSRRWTVSIIDVNGVGKHFISSHKVVDFSSRTDIFYELKAEKYLKLSFLWEHADELLPKDVLTLRYDISYVSCAGKKNELEYGHLLQEWPEKFSLPTNNLSPTNLMEQNKVTSLNKPLARNGNIAIKKNNISNFSALDTSLEINKRNAINDESNSKNVSKLEENDWTIKINAAKVVISLTKGKDTYGNKLISASPIFKCMTNIDMKEKHTKYIDLSHIETKIFFDLLYFLQNGILSNDSYCNVKKLYALAHMYMMEELQHVCAVYIARSLNCANFSDAKSFADFYADEYLIGLVKSKYFEIFGIVNNSFERQQNEDRLDCNCYM